MGGFPPSPVIVDEFGGPSEQGAMLRRLGLRRRIADIPLTPSTFPTGITQDLPTPRPAASEAVGGYPSEYRPTLLHPEESRIKAPPTSPIEAELASLQGQRHELQQPTQPLSLKQKILRAVTMAAPIALGGAFGGSEGATGAGLGVAEQEARRQSLAERMRQEQVQQQGTLEQRIADWTKMQEQERFQQQQQRERGEQETLREKMKAATTEEIWQKHRQQEQEELDRRFGRQQAEWDRRQAETETRQEEREKRAEGRLEAREIRGEKRTEEKETAKKRQSLQKIVDSARDIDALEVEQRRLLEDVDKTPQRGAFGGGPYLNGPQSMQFLANHMALTVGRIKGARTGKDLIEKHIAARSLDQTTEALAQRILAGGVLTYQQAQQMLGTTGVKRYGAWNKVLETADDYGIDISDRVPAEFGGSATPRGGAPSQRKLVTPQSIGALPAR